MRSAQSGSLQILGQELNGATSQALTEARRNHGYIFQAHNLHSSLTALQNVRMGLELHHKYSTTEMNARATEMLKVVGLGDRLNYYPDDLSGGQKQRVALAKPLGTRISRALVSHPQLVLADEPTAARDSKSGRDVVDLMQTLAREQGCTILLVTHDNRILDIAVREAWAMPSRIVDMEDGRLINTDPVALSV